MLFTQDSLPFPLLLTYTGYNVHEWIRLDCFELCVGLFCLLYLINFILPKQSHTKMELKKKIYIYTSKC